MIIFYDLHLFDPRSINKDLKKYLIITPDGCFVITKRLTVNSLNSLSLATNWQQIHA